MSSASAVRLSPSVQKQKLKLELLRGSRLKLESLPVSVVVHEHLVRAGCMFFGTATRRTLTRLHRPRGVVTRDFSAIFGRLFDRSSRSMFDLGPSPLDSTGKNIYHIRAHDFGVQFPLRAHVKYTAYIFVQRCKVYCLHFGATM